MNTFDNAANYDFMSLLDHLYDGDYARANEHLPNLVKNMKRGVFPDRNSLSQTEWETLLWELVWHMK